MYISRVEARARGRAAGIDRGSILAAAARLLADDGSARFSMRALAAELGVTPNALYNHVRDKTELVDALLDDALGSVRWERTADPRGLLTAIMLSTYDVLSARRHLVPLYLERRGARGPNAVALGERMHEALDALGVEPDVAGRLAHVLIVQAIGFAAYGATHPEPSVHRAAFLDSLGWTLDGALGARRGRRRGRPGGRPGGRRGGSA